MAVLSLLQFAHADLSCGIDCSMQSPPVLSILCRDNILLAWSSWSLGSTQTRLPMGFDLLNANFLSSSIFSLPLFVFFAGQASREAHLHLYFKPGPVASSCSPHQPSALGIHGKCLPWWHRLHYQERRVAEEVR